ncbi:MAG: phage major capsid protein, partial [Bacteroidetes bacterium]|nr:phage major capsid protein [Bacteroidota bacterium]
DGSPIVVSEYIYDNLNASGVYDGVTATKTIMLAVNTAAFVIGDRRLVTVKTDENIETDQQLLVCTQRKDFKSFFDTDSETVVGMGYNLTA